MIDPNTGFIINTEETDENDASSSYPCIDLIDTSDEEESTTDRGASKDQKRAWRQTDKQEWLNIYQQYMQERSKRKPRPLDFPKCLGKDIIIGRESFKPPGRPRKRLKEDGPEDKNAEYLDLNDLDHMSTTRRSGRLRAKSELNGILHCNEEYLEEYFSEVARQDADESSQEFTRKNGRLKKELKSNGDRNESFEGVEESFSKYSTVKTRETDGAIYLELGFDEDSDINTNDANANIEEFEDVEYLNEDLIDQGTSKSISNAKKYLNLRHNSIKLFNYSNMCPFKWTKHYFLCYVCKVRLKEMRVLRSHMNDSHTKGEVKRKMAKEKGRFYKVDITKLACSICLVDVSDLDELENHLLVHNIVMKPDGSALIPYRVSTDELGCTICGEEFQSRYRLQRHMDGHFLNYVCPKCSMGFPNSASLKKHSRKHVRIEQEFCETSLERIKRRAKLRRKERSEDRFKCSQCPQKFKYDYKRIQHMIEDHNKETKLFQCEFCPKIFMTVHWLTKHTICVHQDEMCS